MATRGVMFCDLPLPLLLDSLYLAASLLSPMYPQ